MSSVDERLAAIEVNLNQLLACTSQTSDRMNSIIDRLEIVARLEERYKSLDARVAVLSKAHENEMSRRTSIDEVIFERVRAVENSTGIQDYRGGLSERLLIPVITAIVTGLLTFGAVRIFQ